MSVLNLPRIHFRGLIKVNVPTAARSGHIDTSTNTVYMDGKPFDISQPADLFHSYLRQLGPRFNAQGEADETGVFNQLAGWNYNGRGCATWEDVRVVSAQISDNTVDTSDCLVGSLVELWGHYNEYLGTAANDPRQVESDPASEWTTQIFSGRFSFGRRDPSHTTPNLFTGDVGCIQHARWLQFDHIRMLPNHCYQSAMAKSVLFQFACEKGAETFIWSEESLKSPVVKAFKEALEDPSSSGLVIQYAFFNMNTPTKPDQLTFYEVIGTIGIWKKDELMNYPAGRLLVPKRKLFTSRKQQNNAIPRLGNLTVSITDQKVSLNMVSSIPVMGRENSSESPEKPLHKLGPKMDLGTLELCLAPSGRVLARIPASAYELAAYFKTSGIVDLPLRLDLTPELANEIASNPLYITAELENGQRVVVLEEQEVVLQTNQGNIYVEFPNRRTDELMAEAVEIYSFVRGKLSAVPNISVKAFYNTRGLPQLRYKFEENPLNQGKQFYFPKNSELAIALFKPGRLEETGEYLPACQIATNEQGKAWLSISGNQNTHGGGTRVLLAPTTELADLPFRDNLSNEAEYNYDYNDLLGVWSQLGFFGVRVLPDEWHYLDIPQEEVDFKYVYEQVLSYYELTYPFMKTLVFSLAEKWKCEMYAHLMWQMCDPKNKHKTYCMPVTRELSAAKASIFLKYMRNTQAVQVVTESAPDKPAFIKTNTQKPNRIETRAQLVEALKDAIELELSLLFQYLYAAYSLPNYTTGQEYVKQGRWTEEQLKLICGDGQISMDYAGGWRSTIIAIAHEEMIHFQIANNLLMAIGEPFYARVPEPAEACQFYPMGVEFALEPFSAATLERFIKFEWPGYFEPKDDTNKSQSYTQPESEQGYRSVSELYRQIRQAFETIPDLIVVKRGKVGGEHRLFLNEFVDRKTPDYQFQDGFG